VVTGLDLQLMIWRRLEDWHEQHQTPDADWTRQVLLESRILSLMAVDGASQRDAREEIGCSKAEMARHLLVLCEAFPPFEEFLRAHARRLRAGDRPAAPLPMMADTRTSRRKLKAPADGRWIDVPDSRIDDEISAA
jgi:hypothetical protein